MKAERLLFLILTAACALGSAPAPTLLQGVTPPEPPSGFDLTGELVGVVDGDTIEIQTDTRTVRIRLAGINAPEGGECYGDVARDHLGALIGGAVGAEVVGTDQFGRTLAYVWVRDMLVNLDLVTRGLALASTPGEGEHHGSVILQAEDLAYQERLGLWSPEACGSGPLPRLEFVPAASVTNPSGPDDRVLSAERIVVVNRDTEPVDMEGWVLRDESSRHRYHFPRGILLGSGYVFVISSDLPGWDPGGTPVWNNTGDMALLLDPAGRIAARWRYSP